MKKLIITFAVLISTVLLGQTEKPTIFKITANSEISVKADLIIFQISISEENSSPEEAYRIHKEKESKLADLIKNSGIADSSVSYSLLSISKSRMKNKEELYRTNQKIKLVLHNFDQYEKLQIKLLKNGINEFRSTFSSTKIEEIRKEGIKKLTQAAKREAEIYADNLGLKVGGVIEISSNNRSRRGARSAAYLVASSASESSLLEIPQSYSVNFSANFTFALVK